MSLSNNGKDWVAEWLMQLKDYYLEILKEPSFEAYERVSSHINKCYEELAIYSIGPEHKTELQEIQRYHHQLIDIIQFEQSQLRNKMDLLDRKQAANNQYQRYQASQESFFLDRKQ
ncbi:hypothetical protein [Paenibacillus agilis]|uniref:Flagellar protein FliT n=1 Tax=Paenibacillus agilis TaxID=3020863 RepID=A0A559IP94_9BACL|nr:hypothetical protein [Paenibacillus agilis]TVX89445.1 hypothetical protein FPZ44_16825 [Paenibacillus agilis]